MIPLCPNIPWPNIFECFLLYCVADAHRKIKPETADGYVSAILKFLDRKLSDYNSTRRDNARSPLYGAVYKALRLLKDSEIPKRLTARIPFTLPFIIWSCEHIAHKFAGQPLYVALLQAILATGHALSLRPGEYLHSSHNYPPNRYLNAHSTFLWFSGIPYSAIDVDSWPRIISPSHITSVLDVRKNTANAGGSVSMAANPRHHFNPAEFCCVHTLTEYIRVAGLKEGDPLFVFNGIHENTVAVTAIMKECFIHHDLDPDRVVPASLRKNVITQMEINTPQLQRRLQGGWRSNAGEEYYWAQLLQVADANQSAVHDTGCATIAVIRNIFSAANHLPNVGVVIPEIDI